MILDLGGATVLPGIIDAHAHLMSLGESSLKLDLKGVATPEEAARRVKSNAIVNAREGQLVGVGAGQMSRVAAV